MSNEKLNAEQKSIQTMFEGRKTNFLIPDYQRPYAWDRDLCARLWEDLYEFALYPEFDFENDEYFLGSIVAFKDQDGLLEVIDGQQRLTTILLLLRAFYEKHFQAAKEEDDDAKELCKNIARCIWKTDEDNKIVDLDKLKIDSLVATDDVKAEFVDILKTGKAPEGKKKLSRYADNFCFFKEQIDNLQAAYAIKFPKRILNNVILLSVVAGQEDTALRIFSTLNDRGLPLSDSDIFKSKFYNFFSKQGDEEKETFIKRWKELEDKAKNVFLRPSNRNATPMDELFTRYMYFLRAQDDKQKNSTTMQALRDFYSKNKYQVLESEETLSNLEYLLECWHDVKIQNRAVFSESTLRHLFVLNYAPNSLWTFIVSVWFLVNKNEDKFKATSEFENFLDRLSVFIFAYTLQTPTLSALRAPIFPQMANLIEGKPVDFDKHLFDKNEIEGILQNYVFSNNRRLTRSMLTWWLFNNPDCKEQTLLPLEMSLQIEHIFPVNRNGELSDKKLLESLGNKSLLEERINIRASDYRFSDKLKKYAGEGNPNNASQVCELKKLAQMDNPPTDFAEKEIKTRNDKIISTFVKRLAKLNLLKA